MENQSRINSHKGGRHPKKDPATNRYTISLTAEENARFLSLFEQSGMNVKAHFITACIFQKGITTIKVDKASVDYVISLRSFQGGIEYSEYEGIVSPAYTILKEIVPISKLFYKVYFKTETFINRLNTIIYGIRDGKQIGFGDFSTLNLPYPSIEEQKAIANILNAAKRELMQYEEKLNHLQLQKKGLMQQLLTGKTRTV